MNGLKRFNVIVIFSLIVLLFGGFTPQQKDKLTKQERKAAKEQFHQKYNSKFKIRWNENTGTPYSIVGSKIKKYSGTPEQIAKAFLKDEKGMLGIENITRDMELEKTSYSTRGGTRLTFTQKYNNVPVLYSGYLVAVNDLGEIYFVSGDVFPEVDVNTNPSITASQAENSIKADLAGSKLDSLESPQLFIYVTDKNKNKQKFELVYKSTVVLSGFTGFYEYLISAQNGKIISKKDLVLGVNGSGYVYDTNPTHGGTTTKTLLGLVDQSPRELDGDNIIVYNDAGSEASSSTAQFLYDSSNSHFDETMVYYYSDKFERWLVGLGMSSSKVSKVTSNINNTSIGKYAGAVPAYDVTFFSDGTGYPYENPTFEATIITHEYMHVVSYQYTNLYGDIEEKSMNEAYSDYFAISYKYDLGDTDGITGEFVNYPSYVRNLNTFYDYDNYREDPLKLHLNGQILSGALWDLREDADTDTEEVDEIILESLNNLDSNTSFEDARDAVLAADAQGSYEFDIKIAFSDHKIGSAPVIPPTPGSFQCDDPDNWGNYPEFSWSESTDAKLYKIERKKNTGSFVQVAELDAPTTEWTDTDLTLENRYDDDFTYRIRAWNPLDHSNYSGTVLITGIAFDKTSGGIPNVFALSQNYPNPFNPVTEIKYQLPKAAYVTLTIYNVSGQEVAKLVDQDMSAGFHSAKWNAGNFSSGTYFYRLTAGNYTSIKRMVVIK